MIGMSSSSRSFESLGTYLVAGRSGLERERVAWSASRHLPTRDPELGAKIMRATAAQNVRVDKPVYHLTLSFDPTDSVDRAAMERVADRVIAALALEDHQAIIVAHKDRGHPHVHLLVNRVHPETGRVWSRWQDQRVVQQVLREEEQALGLRQVPGTLTQDIHRREAIPGASETPESLARNANSQAHSPNAAAEEVASSLRVYERVTELTQLQYAAKLDAEAARARTAQLSAAFERARAADEAFARALGAVYRAPENAREALGHIASQQGVEMGIRMLRKAPERLGALITAERRGPLGFGREADDGPARAAAGRAALLGGEAVAAGRALLETASHVRARRLDDEFARALRSLYSDPEKAREAFRALATERESEHAATVLRERPGELGRLHPSLRDDPVKVSALARVAAGIGLEARRAEVVTAASVAGPWDAKRIPAEVATERGASDGHAIVTAERDRMLRRELEEAPVLPELRRTIAQAADRLLPRELRRLRTMISAPQLALVTTLRATVRDALLAQEIEHNV